MSRLESLLLRKRARWVRRGAVGKGPTIGNSLAVYSTAKQRLIETGWACGGALASKVVLLARNRHNLSVGRLQDHANENEGEQIECIQAVNNQSTTTARDGGF